MTLSVTVVGLFPNMGASCLVPIQIAGRHEWVSDCSILLVQKLGEENTRGQFALSQLNICAERGLEEPSTLFRSKSGIDLFSMTLSPTREYLCFIADLQGNQTRRVLKLINVDDKVLRDVPLPPGGVARYPKWAPDSKGVYLLCAGLPPDLSDLILLVDIQTGNVSQIVREADLALIGFAGTVESLWYRLVKGEQWITFSYDTRTGVSEPLVGREAWTAIPSGPAPFSSLFLDARRTDGKIHNVRTNESWLAGPAVYFAGTSAAYSDELRQRAFLVLARGDPRKEPPVLRIVDSSTGREIAKEVELGQDLWPVTEVRVSPNGSYCSVAGRRRVVIYDWMSGEVVKSIPTELEQ